MASRLASEFTLAKNVIDDICNKAISSGAHQEGDWRQLSVSEHISKLYDHLGKCFGPLMDELVTEDDLGNAACRIMMLLQLREEAKLK